MIGRNRRFEIMAHAPDDAPELLALAEEFLARSGDEVHVVVPPRVGLLMLRVREPVRGEVFNAGEALVTEARVRLSSGVEGYAMRLGRAPEAALAAALLDAAIEAEHPLSARIIGCLNELERDEDERRAIEWRAVAATRVTFDEMR